MTAPRASRVGDDYRPVRWAAGVPWLPRTYDAVIARHGDDVVAAVAALVEGWNRGAAPEWDNGEGQVGLRDGAMRVVLAKDSGVILTAKVKGDYVSVSAGVHADRVRDEQRLAGPRVKGAKGAARGPRDFEELVAWLEDAGLVVSLVPGGHWHVKRGGVLVTTLPATPSDHRSLANSVSELRKATGLPLRVTS